ncbi:hypothetical protein [Lysobacter capsici]|uniref:hypothetical protein n=1 Tax=Lysobacter capsici TaxID=435897 RepID=UPI001C005944|nr:hypothetical protein [Lysobacter capsici]QWF16997.1 hypothetical protein KME82_25260 [Lysobacter capsici]
MHTLAASLACAFALAYSIGPAQANTEASAAHAQAMNDIAATPPCCDGGGDDEWQGYEPNFSAEELEQMLRQSQIEEAQSKRKHEARMASDPEYRSFFEGLWNFRPAPDNAPGQYCAARFYREGSGMMIFGPAQGSPTAYLAMYGPGVPIPNSARKTTVQLYQTGEQRQTVEVFNLPMAGTGGNGMLLMAADCGAVVERDARQASLRSVRQETQRGVLHPRMDRRARRARQTAVMHRRKNLGHAP